MKKRITPWTRGLGFGLVILLAVVFGNGCATGYTDSGGGQQAKPDTQSPPMESKPKFGTVTPVDEP
ncbi:MAG TPA: hypothetical protein VK731_05520 [Candidatus Cybelea sp.]|nr:hypothetical protein [Candidatus Cybelea sp.]